MKAENILKEINYYRFTGYALQFRKNKSNSDLIENCDFEKILKIYKFDEELRVLLLKIYWFNLDRISKKL